MIRSEEKRILGPHQEYPGTIVWYEYAYLCPVCRRWSGGSDVTQDNEDGTESVLCPACADKIVFDESANVAVSNL